MCNLPSAMASGCRVAALMVVAILPTTIVGQEKTAQLPDGVEAVWDVDRSYHVTTRTRERICINGLWRWQPADRQQSGVPTSSWGYFKVPGAWPGITSYMQKDCQTVFAHPDWAGERLSRIDSAWYEREITIPKDWTGRRMVLRADCLNSYATVYVDDNQVGVLRFPCGELDLTKVCQPGTTHRLSLHVVAMPLKAVMVSFRDTAAASEVRGGVARRGLCGDVFVESMPTEARITKVRVSTSVRKWQIRLDVAMDSLPMDDSFQIRAVIHDRNRTVHTITSSFFTAGDLRNGRFTSSHEWRPDKLWDVHTPQNQYQLSLALLDREGNELDRFYDVDFGFREFWIDGRDFVLNGDRIYLSSVPLDNAQVGAAWANYDAARESLRRLQNIGINYVYTHNYGCEPGSHLAFEEILRAADDVGVLVGLSQPHFSHYDWESAGSSEPNAYAQHASYYCDVAGSHPSVVAYSMSHNATGYAEDMNPDMIDGKQSKRSKWSNRNVQRAQRAEEIVRKSDPERIVYHHASGNLGPMHTSNFYANFAPIQEMSDWFGHWAKEGVKPLFTCEYSVPLSWDWTMYRGWYKGKREFGSARVPWEFCLAEWNAQFLGDAAYQLDEREKTNLRWESRQFAAGNRWHRWDYPHVVGSEDFEQRAEVYAMYFRQNWPAFRTWGVSAIAPWNHGHHWRLKPNVDRSRQSLEVDWKSLQKPGFSADYIEDRYERVDLAFKRSDWQPSIAAKTLVRLNGPFLAYIAGPPSAFTSQEQNFVAGEVIQKQLIIVNNSRNIVSARCTWSWNLPGGRSQQRDVTLKTGTQVRIPLQCKLPADVPAGAYQLNAHVDFFNDKGGSKSEPFATQGDSSTIQVLAHSSDQLAIGGVGLFDPKGETAELLTQLGVRHTPVTTDEDVSKFRVLVIGKEALTLNNAVPNIDHVRSGLRVVVFEQSPEVLEQRLGFRVATYGLRWLFGRVHDHPILKGVGEEHLRHWRGEATIVPPRLKYETPAKFNNVPTVKWCGMDSPRLWRCGNRGNVATAIVEKPHCGDFLPVLDGGYALQYSPLLEYREGDGLVLFCQLDVTGRTQQDPAAVSIAKNILEYAAAWKAATKRRVAYAGSNELKAHLQSAGVECQSFGEEELDRTVLLVVGSDGWSQLRQRKNDLETWLKTGGRLVAVELDKKAADDFLPGQFQFRRAEHIGTYFEAKPMHSVFRGIGPADVHNPAPCEIDLLTSNGAIGNGVLGSNADGSIIVCQLSPERFVYDGQQRNVKRTYRRTSYLLSRLLANLGAGRKTPLLRRFSQPVTPSESEAGRWSEGFYLDTPELWDDPYRFFRW